MAKSITKLAHNLKNYLLSYTKQTKYLTCLFMLLFSSMGWGQVSLTATAGTASGSFTTLKGAFDAINAGTHQGVIVISITANTTEGTTPATLNSTGAGSSSYSSINIRPTSDGVSISGNPIQGFGVIQLKGADNVTIDGDNPNSGGTNRNLTITNTAVNTTTYTSVIRITTVNVTAALSADNITIKNCIITGSASSQNASGTTSSTGSGNTTFGILVGYNGGSTATDAPTAQASVTGALVASTTVNSLLVDNNAINSCARGVAFIGNATTASSTGITIQNNLIGEQATSNSGAPPYTSPATTVYTKAIVVQGTNAYSITGNTIKNILSYVATTMNGIEVSSSGAGTGAAVVNNNSITGVVNNGTSAANGINLAGATWSSLNVNSNTITNIQAGTSGSGVNGITIATAPLTGNLIEKNSISFVYARSTTGYAATGINQAGTNSLTIQNNMIWDLNAVGNNTTTGTTYGVRGIRLSAGTNHKIYNNTVSLSGALLSGATGVDVTAALTITATSITGVDVRNNIFSNTMTGASAKHACVQIPTGATSAMNLLIDNNAYYGSATVNVGMTSGTLVEYPFANFVPSSTSGATNWRNYSSSLLGANTNNDNSSLGFTAAAPFVSSTDLHISTGATPTQLESGGVSAATTSVTTDIDGHARPGPSGSTNGGASAPDLGADEFDGVPLDLISPSISSITLVGNACNTTSRNITATISDGTGVDNTASLKPRIYFRKNGGSYSSDAGSLTSGSVNSGTWTFTITFATLGGAAVSDVIDYFIVAQDVAGTPNVGGNPSSGLVLSDVNTVTTPPTTPLTYTISNTISGAYTVGSGGAYATLTAAVAAYNTSCLGGAVTFNLTDATYAGETFPITINANADASASNTLTIKPASGVTASISGSSAVAIFKLNGADYVIIDGSNNGSTSKDLTIINTNTGTSSAVVWLGSASVSNGATNNTIKNCIVTGDAPTTTLAGLISSSGTTIGAEAEIANANNTYNNNTVNTANYGIAVVGPIGNESGTVISGNLIGSATAGNKIGLRGIGIWQQTGVSVTGNTIFGVTTATTSTASGIYVSGTQSGGTISGNKISDIKNTNTTGYGSNGIGLYSSSTTGNVTVQNNMIYDVAAKGYASGVTHSDNGYGIMINSGGGYNIYFNTVSLSVNQTTAGMSAAINIASSVTALNIRNNIFSNSQTTGTCYAIYTAGTAAGFTTINFNDYSSSGSVGFLNSAKASLNNWKNASNQDASSIGVAPTFTSATDLHLTAVASASGNAALKAGTYLSTVLTDYDGETRNVTIPAIGADEIFINGFWTGTSTTAYETSGNWDDNAVPSSGANITIPTGVTNKPLLASDKTIGTLALGSGTTLSIGSNTLTINGEVSGTGTLTGSSTSNLTIGGTVGTLNFTNGSRSLKDLTLNSSATATLGTALAITAGTTSGTVTVGTSATLTTGGNLTLKSDANGTARVGNSAGTISGNVTVERYIPAGKRAFRLLSPAVTTTTFISGNWQGQTHITGGLGTTGLGFDATETNNPSMFTFDNQATSGSGWASVANTNATNLIAGTGYRVLIRGNRSVDLTAPSADAMNAAVTLSATGTLRTGSITLDSSSSPSISNTNYNAGFSLVGNPYQSPIDWNAVTKTNIEPTYYAWDPNMGTTSQRGRYVSFNGSDNSVSVDGIGSSNVGQFIQPGQAFFVKNTGSGAGSLTFDEADKVATNANVFRTANPTTLTVSLYDPNELAIAGYPIDAMKAVFSADYTNDMGLGDAIKLEASGENMAWYRNATKLAIDAAAPLTSTDELAMKTIRLGANKNYTLKINTTNFDATLTPYLLDNFLNTQTEISTTQAHLATFNTTDVAASFGEDRFKIVFQPRALSTDDFTHGLVLYPNPAKAGDSFYVQGSTAAQVTVYNVLGQHIPVQVKAQGNALQVTPAQTLSQGIYLVTVTTEGKTQHVKWIVE